MRWRVSSCSLTGGKCRRSFKRVSAPTCPFLYANAALGGLFHCALPPSCRTVDDRSARVRIGGHLSAQHRPRRSDYSPCSSDKNIYRVGAETHRDDLMRP